MTPDLTQLLARYPGAVTYRFGDNAALSARMVALVRSGRKRATCISDAEIDAGETPPSIGRCDIVLDFDDVPQLVTRTEELRPVRYCEMTEEMALLEGENDDLAGWQADHESYYRRLGIFRPDMNLIWERFDVVEDLS
jgi:uncharacterized protein YhfF